MGAQQARGDDMSLRSWRARHGEEPERATKTFDVVEHRERVVEVAPTHVEVRDDARAAEARAAREREVELAREAALERERVRAAPPAEGEPPYEHRRYLDFVAARRTGRFTASAIAMAALTIVSAVWLLLGAGGVAQGASQGTLALAGVVLLASGFVIAWLCRRANLAGLVLGWLSGLVAFGMAVGMLNTARAVPLYPSNVGEVLVAVVGVLGLVVLAAATLALASWRGVRAQRRLIGGDAA